MNKQEFNKLVCSAIAQILSGNNKSTKEISLLMQKSSMWMNRRLAQNSSFGVMELSSVMRHLDTSSNNKKVNYGKGVIRKLVGINKRPKFHCKHPREINTVLDVLLSGYTMRHISKQANISPSSLSLLKSGARDMPLFTFSALILVLQPLSTQSIIVLDDFIFSTEEIGL